MQVKRINIDDVKPASAFQMWLWDSFIYKKIIDPISYFFHRLARAWRWNRECVSKVWDFDAHGSFLLILYHLEQVKKSIEGGYRADPTESTKSLGLAIRLLKRLHEDKYEEIGHDRFQRKWGALNTWVDGKGYFQSRFVKESESNREVLRRELLEMYRLSEVAKKRDLARLGRVVFKYYQEWWD